MSHCREKVLYKYGREGRDACWSSLTTSLNNYATRQKTEMCLPPPQLSSRSACDSSKYYKKMCYNVERMCYYDEPLPCRTESYRESYLCSPQLSSKSACDSSKYEYKSNCVVNEPKCRSVSRDASPNYRSNCSSAVSNGVSASKGGSASSVSKSGGASSVSKGGGASSASNCGGAASASKRRSDPIKTPPPQPQPPKQVPPPLERRLTARRFRSASTPRRPMDVQSPDRAPDNAQSPPAASSCSSEVASTPRASRGSRQDVPLVCSQALFSESKCVEDAKKNGLAVVPPAEPPANSAVEPATVQLATGVEVTSSPTAVSDSLICKSPVKTSVANPDVIVAAVDETVTYQDKKVTSVDEVVIAVDVMEKTAVEKKSVTTVDKKVSAIEETETSVEVLMTTALDETVNAMEEVLTVPGEILTALNETLVAAEATISTTEGTVTTAVKGKVTAAEEIVTVVYDSPKFTKTVEDCDIKSELDSEVLVVPNKKESLVLDEYEMKIKKIDENIVLYSKSFIWAVLLFVMCRVIF